MATSNLTTTALGFYSDNLVTRSASIDSTALNTIRVTGADNATPGTIDVSTLTLPNSNLITAEDGSRIKFGSTGDTILVCAGILNNAGGVYIDSNQHISIGANVDSGTINIATGATRTLTIGNGVNTAFIVDTNNFDVDTSGNVTATTLTSSSDERLKHNIEIIPDALSKLAQLRGVSFQWNKDDSSDIGVIAQEVEAVFPTIVVTHKDGFKSVDYGKLTPLLIQSIKEQQILFQNQQTSITRLEEQINAITPSSRG